MARKKAATEEKRNRRPRERPRKLTRQGINLKQDEAAALLSSVANCIVSVHRFFSENDLYLLPSQTASLHSSLRSSVVLVAHLHSLFSLPDRLSVPRLPSPNPKRTCWFHRFSFSASSSCDSRWSDFFHMPKPVFDRLLLTIDPALSSPLAVAGASGSCSREVPSDYKLGAAIFRLAHAAPFPVIGKLFGFDQETACASFYQVCKALHARLGHIFEFSSSFLPDVIHGFSSAIGLPNCCGALGFRKFVAERDASEEGSDLENGVTMMGLVDSEGRFMDVSVGWPSSMPPSKILPNTHLYLEGKEAIGGPSFELANGFPMPVYVLGDSCCPNLPWLMTPYSQSNPGDKDKQAAYNSLHERGMKVVEMALGRVQSLWKLLAVRPKTGTLGSLPVIVTSACILYNFLMKCGETMPGEVDDCLDKTFPDFHGRNEDAEGARDALASHIMELKQVTQ
ncbi:protein ANTAGONIST OF LIKE HETEROCHROMATIN PROTEIN 1 [Nymphaea colorata]|nr:protein ANTAGONIST OF LIKE HETEROCHROMATIN PROTEIN 1 [Nymphaea colorata]